MVVRSPSTLDQDAFVLVSRNDVAHAGGRPTDRVVRTVIEIHTVTLYPQGSGARDVGADEVARNEVVVGLVDVDTVPRELVDH